MKRLKASLLLSFILAISNNVNSQTNYVCNGGFEQLDPNVSYSYVHQLIDKALNWKILSNTPDLYHMNTSVGTADVEPNSGLGHAYFVPSENFFGRTCSSLTAGTNYQFSCFTRPYFITDSKGASIYVYITDTEPTSVSALEANNTPVTYFSFKQRNDYLKTTCCFTPTTSGNKYISFVSRQLGENDGTIQVKFMLDDVSIVESTGATVIPDATITGLSSTGGYCQGDPINLNGATSNNETYYNWELFQLVNGQEILVNQTGITLGQTSTLNVNSLASAVSHLMTAGKCYRAYLNVYNDCNDRTSVDFCIINPNINFITDGNPVCENIPRDLQVTGDNGWTYTWSTGQSGVGLKTISITPTIGNSTYTVTVTTPEGCTSTKTITLVVNSQNNVAPWADGINGTGEYTYYVRQNDAVFFNSLVSNDHLTESMQYSNSNTIPGGFVFNYPSSLQGGVFSFSWVTSLATPVGEYHYYLTANDRNSCGEGISTFDFRIIVVCDQCPVCLDYENRTPGSNPLPPETKAGKCIEAGMSQVVSTGDANVLFQAGVSITEGPYFDAGPGYEGVIEPTTCITDCEDCCADWDGFHIDNPYYTIINFWDNDPTNNSFELTDFDHPFCSYGSKRFDMYIDDADDGSNYAHFSGGGYQCCMLQTRTPENPIPHSSIFWDGYLGGDYASKQYYRIQVILYDCNDLPHDFWFMVSVTSLGSQLAQNNSGSALPMENTLAPDSAIETDRPISDSTTNSDQELGIYPNPATNMLYISGSRSETTTIQLYDEKGRVLTKREKVALNQGYNLEAFSAGTYYCRIYKNDGSYTLKQFIKL